MVTAEESLAAVTDRTSAAHENGRPAAVEVRKTMESPDQAKPSALSGGLRNFLRRLLRREPAKKRCHLHLGVHKTGTTYSQTVFWLNREKLKAAGVHYWELGQARRTLTPCLLNISRSKPDLPREECLRRIGLQLQAPEVVAAERILLSDENLTGFIRDIVRKKGYRGLLKRLTPMREALGGDVRVFLTIRSYADFVSSMYCELVATKSYFPFQEVREGDFVKELSWFRVYLILVKVFGWRNVVIFEYDDFFKRPTEYLRRLAGADIDFEFPKKQIRVSVSAKAVEYIAAESATSGLTVSKLVKQATKLFPRNAENPAYDPWTPEERARLNRRYRWHLLFIPRWRPPGMKRRAAVPHGKH